MNDIVCFMYPQTPTSAFKKPLIENELNFLTVNRNLLAYDSISIFIGKTEPERLPVSQGKDGNDCVIKFRFLNFSFLFKQEVVTMN